MAIVYHDEGIVFFCQITDFFQSGNIAVHREYSVGNDNPETLSLRNFELFFQIFHIGMFVSVTNRFT